MELSEIRSFAYNQRDWFARLIRALIAASLLRFDREARQCGIGIRTYIMISLRTAIFSVVQGLVDGVGFLGADAIIQDDKSVGGMVSAASLSVASAVGLVTGREYGAVAFVSPALAVAVLWICRFMEYRGVDDRPDADRVD
jgi:putative Mg2+ transporter-C (MgtC) family protein